MGGFRRRRWPITGNHPGGDGGRICLFGFKNLRKIINNMRGGGVRDVDPNANDLQVESLARFAVDEHNKKENVSLEYRRLIGAKTQVVAGTMHHLTVEVADGETKKVYEAKVLEKAWENFKKLEDFTHLRDV